MTDTSAGKGQCLCGAVKITADTISPEIGACHCSMCRKWAGGPLLAVDCGNEVSFEGEENIGIYDSSEWAQRGFCKQCGTHLFYLLKEPKQYIMPVGFFDNLDSIVFDHQIFIDEKPDYYSFSNKTHNMTGEEVFAQYAPKSE